MFLCEGAEFEKKKKKGIWFFLIVFSKQTKKKKKSRRVEVIYTVRDISVTIVVSSSSSFSLVFIYFSLRNPPSTSLLLGHGGDRNINTTCSQISIWKSVRRPVEYVNVMGHKKHEFSLMVE
jgi:hypothetical protein